ncbi:MAG TPA: type II toxin-antitoxin system VapC family toxin [Rubrivivax sp.]|jgi:predicted nucleic acid-binding protein|nr:type II toxin-antitoxin system VapC family toxin [Rubrivivax sp.]
MAALDTNVVLRLIVGDDAKQARAAEKLVAAERCSVAPSVLMECEWVLRAVYRLDPAVIAASFRDLLALQHIDALDPVLTQQALRGYRAGLDFADALHAAQRRDGERFATFDRQLARRAPKAGVLAVALLPG